MRPQVLVRLAMLRERKVDVGPFEAIRRRYEEEFAARGRQARGEAQKA